MIIKFKSGDTWVVFGEVDHIEYREYDGDPRNEGHTDGIILYDPPNNQAVTGKWIGMGFFTKNMNASTEIIACTPIYIMNDQGRTIETV